ncbi:MAG: DNA repair protein RadA [Clostridia bacterium]|nr:DNA repair protein RadA [Clostridia bacterium]
MKSKSSFVCTECEYKSIKWMGKCPSCGTWNSLEEVVEVSESAGLQKRVAVRSNPPVLLDEYDMPEYMRFETGYGELDRVLGGGLVHGSVVLISGEPGIGKSTLLMQICNILGQKRTVLYVSGEESCGQLKLRAKRLGVKSDKLFLLTETNIDVILSECDKLKPDVLIVDSVQTVYTDRFTSAPGSITQVREGALACITKAKSEGLSVILVGHVNKEGGISGPKVLEHMVDAVLYFEGERRQSYRIIRAIKNRFGSTNEIGVFEMTDEGLTEVANPSEAMLSDRPKNVSGNCAVCVMEGTRPIIAEVQALVTQTPFSSPRRTANGIDYNRMCLVIAVLEKRLGLKFYQNDVYLNVTGGLRLDEPSADLAIALALISGITDRVLPDDLIAFGEIGLSGECRAVSHFDYRVKESSRLGFNTIVFPKKNSKKLPVGIKANIFDISNLYDTLKLLKEPKNQEV